MRRFGSPASGSVSTIIGAFKAAVTKRVRALEGPNAMVWQRSFYEHVIRSEAQLRRIRSYIEDNPRRWAEDEENPDRG
jgi:REP element-mobilizing transposase RayT